MTQEEIVREIMELDPEIQELVLDYMEILLLAQERGISVPDIRVSKTGESGR